MPVSSIELRPRGPVALIDAAIHLCAQDLGIWALALTGGALVTAAVLHVAEALRLHHGLWGPSLWLTAAWFARSLFQGASAHYVERLVLDVAPPSPVRSLREALAHAPSLFVAVAVIACINTLGTLLTLGIGYFVFTAHLGGYAVAMRGVGHPLDLYRTSGRLLGGAVGGGRVWIRFAFLGQLLLGINLHLGAAMLLFIGSKLLGLELAFADRYASITNPAWVLTLISLTFTLTEPLRATVSALLLVDGRVRQEGLDLVAALEQLPRRVRAGKAPTPSKATVIAALVLFALGQSSPAHARSAPPPRPASAQAAPARAVRAEAAPAQAAPAQAVFPPASPSPADPLEEPPAQGAPDTSLPDSVDGLGNPEGENDNAPEAGDVSAPDNGLGSDAAGDGDGDGVPPGYVQSNPELMKDAASAKGDPLSTGVAVTSKEAVVRLRMMLKLCGMDTEREARGVRAAASLGGKEHGALVRLVADAEALAEGPEPNCEAIQHLLGPSLAYLEETVAAQTKVEGAQAAQDKARAILARSEFADEATPEDAAPVLTPDKVPDPDGWWERFTRWLQEFLRKRGEKRTPHGPQTAFSPGSGAEMAQVLMALVAVAVVAVLAYVVFALGPRKKQASATLKPVAGQAPPGATVDGQNALSRPPEGWASLADELARRGDFREAVRSLYLATLSRLHRDGAIDYDPAQSNWEYFRRFRGPREWKPPFRELTTRFDYAFYGNLGVNSEGYERFRELSAPILAAPPRLDVEAPRA